MRTLQKGDVIAIVASYGFKAIIAHGFADKSVDEEGMFTEDTLVHAVPAKGVNASSWAVDAIDLHLVKVRPTTVFNGTGLSKRAISRARVRGHYWEVRFHARRPERTRINLPHVTKYA